MIELGHPKIPVKRQCELLGVPRSSAYYAPVGESAANLALMRLIDELYTLHPFYGVRQITRRLRQLGQAVNFKRVRRLMRLMGLVAQVPKPNLSKPAPGHRIYPYLLRNLEVVRANQVWAMDITYVPIEGGFVYLCAVLDWHSRKVMAWRLSNSMDASFCLEALREALATHGTPGIMNTDQGTSLPVRPSSRCSPTTASGSRWTDAGARWTTSSSSGSGAPSNTRRSTAANMNRCGTCAPASRITSSSTIIGVLTAPWATSAPLASMPPRSLAAATPHETACPLDAFVASVPTS